MYIYSLFVLCLVPAIACQSVDVMLQTIFKIVVDKSCVHEKIGLEAYEGLKDPLNKCVMHIFEEYNPERVKGSPDEEVAKLCAHKESNCQNTISNVLGPCLTEIQKNHLKYGLDSKQASITYACDNQDLLKEFLSVDKEKCKSQEAQTEGAKCQAYIVKMIGISIDDVYKKDSCQLIEQFTTCLADNLRLCAGDSAYKIMKGSVLAGLNATPCKDYVNGSDAFSKLNTMLLVVTALLGYLPNLSF